MRHSTSIAPPMPCAAVRRALSAFARDASTLAPFNDCSFATNEAAPFAASRACNPPTSRAVSWTLATRPPRTSPLRFLSVVGPWLLALLRCSSASVFKLHLYRAERSGARYSAFCLCFASLLVSYRTLASHGFI